MQRTIVDGVFVWSAWQPDRNLFFNAHFIETSDGNCIVDPLPLNERDAADIAERGGAAWVIITNRDHQRDAQHVARHFGAKIAASVSDAKEMSVSVDRFLSDGEVIATAQVIGLAGMKTPGEFALFFSDRRTVLVGDALWGDPAGSVRLMPDEKLGDPVRAALSLCRLRAVFPKHLLLGDGAPIFGTAFEAISACLDARSGVFPNRVNIDELVFVARPNQPPGYQSAAAEIGWRIGATKLGYHAMLVPPGESFCPSHSHTAEEELFIVWDGFPTLRTPHGDSQLRRGDFVAFPTGERGTHKLLNRSDLPCTVVAIANVDAHDVCFYPDSKKILVRETRMIVRSEPAVAYFEGETAGARG
ncbi:MAG TPA: cupin domain-containing protein [Candidatus Baltobacteraceae bacterium]|jgi:uncharacterized cupin superfamily protein/glyoxylase-like metal-dependent hydrolase (beta-lactamase superfamily II)|nr:cupin domain-containing protein [Candidatus Baltobacteraceae bacterium]